MYSIGLKKLTLVAKAIQKKRYEPHSVAFCQLRVYILKLLRVCYAIIGRQLHPSQQHSCFVSQAGFYDGFEIVSNSLNGGASQSIITAEFDDDDIRAISFKRLLDAFAPAVRRFATDAVVDQICLRLRLRLQSLLQQADPARILRQAIAGGQAVAEYHNRSGCRSRRSGSVRVDGGCTEDKRQKDYQEFFHGRSR